jgi:Tfp pilus assembly protein PilF
MVGQKGNIEEALKYAQKAVELAPDNVGFQDTLGWILYRRGLFPNAINYLQAAAARGSDVRFKYHLGMAYMKAGDERRGKELLTAALRTNPNIAEAAEANELLKTAPAKRTN